MNILHICNGYQTNVLYQKLYSQISKRGLIQYVVSPGYKRCGAEVIDCVNVLYYKRKKGLLRRFLWTKKIKDIYRFTVNNIPIDKIDVIHAHTLFSDGMVAFLLSKKYNIPFVVAIRGADIYSFLKLKVCFQRLAKTILNAASKVILISTSNIVELKHSIGVDYYNSIANKIIIIPNGIDDYWLDNKAQKQPIYNPLQYNGGNIIFVGDFNKNKNIHGCLNAVKKLRAGNYCTNFTAVGMKPDEDNRIVRYLKKEARDIDFFTIKERMSKEQIKKLYLKSDILVVPSFQETFGLVYIEAMSQGLPVIYTNGQGIDGMFSYGSIGLSVNPHDANDIADKITKILNRYDHFSSNVSMINLETFRWSNIAEQYISIYCQIIKQ